MHEGEYIEQCTYFSITAGLLHDCFNSSLRARTCNQRHTLNKLCWLCAALLSEKIGHALSRWTADLFFPPPCPRLSFHDTSQSLRHSRSIETLHFMVYSKERESRGHGVHMSAQHSALPSRRGKKKKQKRKGG